MTDQPAAEVSAVTPPTVVPGLGYPADRLEVSQEPTGWQHTKDQGNVEIVSRETSR